MANDTAKTNTINLVPVQGIFTPDAELVTLIGPAGTPFYAEPDPQQSGLHITDSTIDSTPIGETDPSTAVFTSGQVIDPPTAATDIANKQYVDYYAAGLSWKKPALAATLTNIASLSGPQTIDGVALVAGDTVLVKDQNDAAENGIYTVQTGAWTYSIGGDTWDEYVGAIIFIVEGSQGGSAWFSTAQPGGTLGETDIDWSNFSVASTYTAGTGLTLSGQQFSITNTGVTAATKGSASKTVTATVNAQGQLTSLTDQDIAISNTQVSGLGTMSTQNANNVSITGGSISGTTVAGYAASGANSDITSMSGLTGGITSPDYITFDTTPETVPTATGSLYWDSADGIQTLNLVMTGGNAVQQIGEETYYRVKASSAITEGQVVMFTGTVGASGGLTAAPATGLTASTASYIMGVATENIAENSWGYITAFGLVRNINTTGGGESWVDGQILYYNPSVAGGLTKTAPSAPNAKVQVCAVVHAASNGSLFIRPSFGGILGQYEGDVGFTSTAGSDLIQRNAGNTAWVNVAPSSITGVGSVANSVTFDSSGGAAAGTTFNGSAARTVDYSTVGAPKADGTGASGTWAISVSGNAATATKATNIAGGAANQIPYQTAADTTSFVAAPSDNTWLKYTTGGGLAFTALPATGITIVDDTTTDATRYLTFTSATSGSITTENTASTKLKYNPASGLLDLSGATSAINIPVGTTAQRPGTPSNGMLRYNSSTGYLEGYINSGWQFFTGTPAPVNTVAPVVSGSTTVGATLSVTNGTWSNSPTSYTYQWYRASSPISSATSATYVLQSADNTYNIYCAVTAVNPAGSTAQNSNTVGPVTSTFTATYLAVAGGGGGGNGDGGGGGGGGAGGLLSGTYTATPGTVYTVTVGGGGAGTSNGSDSVISGSGLTTITAVGGGRGGSASNPGQTGGNGGSGGGGGGSAFGAYAGGGGSPTSGQGYGGGSGGYNADPRSNFGGGGGGGAGAAGTNISIPGCAVAGSGGNGVASSITGSSVTYAGGGAAGSGSGNWPACFTSGSPGSGGGGSANSNGTMNLGGGGGGSTGYGGSGSGGSGVVIISVPTTNYSGTTTGSPTVTTSGSNTIIKFTSSGTYTA